MKKQFIFMLVITALMVLLQGCSSDEPLDESVTAETTNESTTAEATVSTTVVTTSATTVTEATTTEPPVQTVIVEVPVYVEVPVTVAPAPVQTTPAPNRIKSFCNYCNNGNCDKGGCCWCHDVGCKGGLDCSNWKCEECGRSDCARDKCCWACMGLWCDKGPEGGCGGVCGCYCTPGNPIPGSTVQERNILCWQCEVPGCFGSRQGM